MQLYIIKCLDPKIKEIYIGTTKNMIKRLKKHKEAYKHYPNRKLYKFILENGGWENWKMELIRTLNDDEDRFIEERICIDANEKNLNMQKPYLKPEEKLNYWQKWKQKNSIHFKEWMDNYKKKYYHCPCGSIVKHYNKCHHFKTLKHKKYLDII